MIEQVVIQNFQSHRKTVLELGRVTVITGHSDAGKSAVLRAIEALCFNQPGKEFVRLEHGVPATHCSILLKLTEGVVMWQKTETGAKYILRETGKPDRQFVKLGRTIPIEVTEFLGINDILIDKDTTYRLQFGGQHEMPFLVGDRGGVAAARVLGRLTGLNIFTAANRRASAEKVKAASTSTEIKVKEAKLETELAVFVEVEDIFNQVKALQGRWQGLQPRQNRVLELKAKRDALKNARQARAALEDRGDVDALTELEKVLWRLNGRILKLTNLTQAVDRLKAVRQIKRQPLPPEPPTLPDIDGRLGRLVRLREFRSLQTGGTNQALEVFRQENNVAGAELELSEFEREIPLCPWLPANIDQVPNTPFRCEELTQLRKKAG